MKVNFGNTLQKSVKRKCDNCGTQKLRELYSETLQNEGERIVKWTEWKKQSMPLNAEKNVVRVLPVQFEDTFTNFFDNLCTALEPHAGHIFRASWQYEQFRDNVNNIKDEEVVMAMDFSEIYTCRHGRETQSYLIIIGIKNKSPYIQ